MASDTAPEAPPEPTRGPYVEENVPSDYRADEPTFARVCGMGGLGLVFVGAAVLLFNRYFGPRALPPVWGQIGIVVGLMLLLFHAAREDEVQIRRSYGVAGLALTLLGAAASLVPLMQGNASGFYPWGVSGLVLGLLFLIPFGKHEDDPAWRRLVLLALGAGGIALAGAGFIGGNFSSDFLLDPGLVLIVLGLGYLWGGVGHLGSSSEKGYRLALVVGAIGVAAVLVALGRSLVAAYGTSGRYFLPAGLLLTLGGLLYFFVALGLASDSRLVVLTRRELAAYFYSPIAYLVLFGFTMFAWFGYISLVGELLSDAPGFQAPPTISEPIVQSYVVNLIPVFGVMFLVPALTMRLVSDEKRTGTLEVLLTAPVSETTVVLSKFIAGLIFYLFNWLPFGLFLIALRVEGGTAFDYRPLLSFTVVLIATGAAFISMGLFFSTLTKNQIIAAVLTFVGMIGLLALYLFRNLAGPNWAAIFGQINFVTQWIDSLGGKLYVRGVLLQLSITVFWLFLSVKVLEARRWS